jgi:transposase
MHERCAGLDVHKDNVVACARLVVDGKVEHRTQTFSTTTKGLLELVDWLLQARCTHVAMEATGVYWKPVWHVLEDNFELLLANASQVRNVPGRKTDVSDAHWLADLLAHGLMRGSFVPERPIQEVRDLMRTRKQLVRERSQHTQRVQKALEDANIKLTGLITDLMGKSGRAILGALVNGETDPKKLAGLAQGLLKKKRDELEEALEGRIRNHHRFLLRLHLDQVDALNASIAQIDAEVGRVLEPFRYAVELVTSIPGVKELSAQVIISEIGHDMSRFPSAAHLRSWACLCPRSDESAGKKRSRRIRPGANWLKATLIQAACAAARAKNTYLRSLYLRIRARGGHQKAVIAVAASMLTAIYEMLKRGVGYEELGPNHLAQADKTRVSRKLVRRLETLGYRVELHAILPTTV